MNHTERNALVATLGLLTVGLGAFLPWARIGGRNRSGFNTADTFIGLADGALPDIIAWVGRWWYLPAFLLLICWGSTFFGGATPLRIVGPLLTMIALVMWWLFIWAGRHYGVLDTRLLGPGVATVGAAIIGYSCTVQRGSIVRPGHDAQIKSSP